MQQVQEAHPTYFKMMDLFGMLVADFEECVILVFLFGLKNRRNLEFWAESWRKYPSTCAVGKAVFLFEMHLTQ